MGVSKDIRFQPLSASKTISKKEEVKSEESWGSGIFSMITNFLYKVPTHHR